MDFIWIPFASLLTLVEDAMWICALKWSGVLHKSKGSAVLRDMR